MFGYTQMMKHWDMLLLKLFGSSFPIRKLYIGVNEFFDIQRTSFPFLSAVKVLRQISTLPPTTPQFTILLLSPSAVVVQLPYQHLFPNAPVSKGYRHPVECPVLHWDRGYPIVSVWMWGTLIQIDCSTSLQPSYCNH